MLMSRGKIARIARQVRTKLDQIAALSPLKVRLAKLHPYPPHLSGACGIASVMLHDELTGAGMTPLIVAGDGHYFVVCEGWLVDVTATQFGHRPIVIRRYADIRHAISTNALLAYWWKQSNAYRSVEQAGLKEYRNEIQTLLSLLGA
jgi:hypothetical protein